MLVHGMEDSPGPPPAGNHAPRAGSQAGTIVRVATVFAPMWADAGICGRPKWVGAGPGWKKRCRELNRISRHQVPDSEDDDLEAGRHRDELALAGQQWAEEGNNPLEQFIHKLHGMFRAVLRARMQREEEQSLLFPIQPRKVPREDYPWHQPALDFQTHAGRPLPPTPQSRFAGTELSLQEKGRVVCLAVTLMGKAPGRESILPARITNHRRSLVPLEVGPVVGEGTPPFHETHGGVAPSEVPEAVQFRTVGAAAVTSGKAAPEAEARPGKDGRRAERQCAATGTMPRQRRGKESSQGVCQRFLCSTNPTGRGAQRHAVQSGGTNLRRSNTCARGGAVLFTPPRQWAGGYGTAAPGAIQNPPPPPPALLAPPGTQGRVRAAGLRIPGGGGTPQLSGPSVTGKHR